MHLKTWVRTFIRDAICGCLVSNRTGTVRYDTSPQGLRYLLVGCHLYLSLSLFLQERQSISSVTEELPDQQTHLDQL